ncbi:16S rRNA (cytosine(1402)-N(4))-methyltransferase RsmH [archaeon]|nr:MAG: 16S rRNA (cytosine(1402)-N(4))-methyltransferase RsmH [archaeon]
MSGSYRSLRGPRLLRHLALFSHYAGPQPTSSSSYHIPVMRNECMQYLNIRPDGLYMDCTLGGGGHTEAILERGGLVIAIDQDTDAIKASSTRLQSYLDSKRLEIHQTNFRNMNAVLQHSALAAKGQRRVDGVLMDLGISSWQIDSASRGFAFAANGPLDMRMSQISPLTAAEIVNTFDIEDIANILFDYGEERRSRSIARAIYTSRPLHTTLDLEKAISSVTSFKDRVKTLARCFQALRIVINDEMGALKEALLRTSEVVRPGGRLVVLSYHSLEDRQVKNVMKKGEVVEGSERIPSSLLLSRSFTSSTPLSSPWTLVEKRFMTPSEEEVQRNKRARSAKLRVAERLREDDMQLEGEDIARDRRERRREARHMGAKQRKKMLESVDGDGE